jgi:hypothetical protein
MTSTRAVKAILRANVVFSAATSASYAFPTNLGKFGIQGNDYQVSFDPIAIQSQTLTINSAVDSTVYSLTLSGPSIPGGRSVSINSGSGSTLTSIAAALVAAVQADTVLNALVTISNVAGVITVVSKVAGAGFTLTGDSRSTAGAVGMATTPTFGVISKTGAGFTVVAASSWTGSVDVLIFG